MSICGAVLVYFCPLCYKENGYGLVFDVVFKMYQEQIWPILERNNESKEAKNRANASPDTADFESASSALSTLK